MILAVIAILELTRKGKGEEKGKELLKVANLEINLIPH